MWISYGRLRFSNFGWGCSCESRSGVVGFDMVWRLWGNLFLDVINCVCWLDFVFVCN